MLVWWNGRRVGLKIRCWWQRVGSSPTFGTMFQKWLFLRLFALNLVIFLLYFTVFYPVLYPNCVPKNKKHPFWVLFSLFSTHYYTSYTPFCIVLLPKNVTKFLTVKKTPFLWCLFVSNPASKIRRQCLALPLTISLMIG